MPDDKDDTMTFKYVYIPAAHTESIEERSFSCPQSDDVMAFINMAKEHFKRNSAPRSQAEQDQWNQAFKASLGDKAAGVDENLINMLAGQQMVEPIALLTNTPDTGFVGVNMYADDQATFKQLPLNMRATQIAAEVGQALQVSGDVFLGRLFDNEEDFKRLDFTMADLTSSAPWVRAARQQLARRSERSGDTQAVLQRLQQHQPGQQPVAGASGTGAAAAAGNGAAAAVQQQQQQSPSDVAKNKGNEAYKKRDYQTALQHYTAAHKLDHSNIAALNNRAATYLALNMHTEAAADTSAVLAAQPDNVKALLRHAAACEALGRGQEATADCQKVLQLEPQNAEAKQRLERLAGAGKEGQQQQQGTAGDSKAASAQEQKQEVEGSYPPPPQDGQ